MCVYMRMLSYLNFTQHFRDLFHKLNIIFIVFFICFVSFSPRSTSVLLNIFISLICVCVCASAYSTPYKLGIRDNMRPLTIELKEPDIFIYTSMSEQNEI